MKLTNNLYFPEPVAAAVRHYLQPRDRQDVGAFSVTELIGPPRIKVLRDSYDDQLMEDISSGVYALFGHGVHDLMLRHAGSDLIVEKRLHAKVALEGLDPAQPNPGAYHISGQFDLIDQRKTLVDYKVSSIWEAKDGLKVERIEQMNLYDYLCHLNGIQIHHAEVTMIFRDWSKMAVTRDANYPPRQIQTFPVPLWTHEEQESFLQKRLQTHVNAVTSLPECTPDERWTRPTVYAVMKEGRKSAVKLFPTNSEANDYIKSIKKDRDAHYVLERPGEDIRCGNYCPVSEFCTQYLEKADAD